MDPLQLCAVATFVAMGAATQRVTGLGFALVSAPLLVLAIGPVQGVLLVNVLNLTTNLLVMAQTWRKIQVKRVLLLAIPALCLVPIGRQVALYTPAAPLMIGIGLVVMAALLAVPWLRRTRVFTGWAGAIAAGGLSGFMNVTAGVGGPAITLYAVGIAWEHTAFVASMQLYFGIVNSGSIVAKGLPSLATMDAVIILAALAVGLCAGHFGARRIPVHRARQAVFALALGGAIATVMKGVLLLW
ncbi:TSUP family transporter [Acidisphaera sp. L21]|uniref:TSUP family transporter n=1 Tax=Acidisphaera sp. L21 TaxID=1641851 RepID=UPI00131C0F73|nr:TSUP family transporter [Acidisphaera sp. L21]